MKKPSISYFAEEKYQCHSCRKDKIERSDVDITWCCPDCGQYIYIYASDEESRGVFIRKRATEIVKGDLVRPNHFKLEEHYQVLGINALTTKKHIGKLGLGLKGFRQEIVEPNDFISCRVGAW